MADAKISALPASTTPLSGTEVLPIVQSGVTKKVANNDLRPKQIQSNATSGVLQVVGPAAASTRVMTTPDANFTVARTDASQTFAGDQTLSGALTASGGLVGNQLSVSNFAASSSAVLRGGATNLLRYSEQLDNAAWSAVNTTVTANQLIAPDGTLSSELLADNATNGGHSLQAPSSTTTVQSYTLSVYAKANTLSRLMVYGLNADGKGAGFDLINGTTFTVTGIPLATSPSIVAVGNGWYRCSIVFTGTATTGNVGGFYTVSGTTFSYAGTGQSLYIWGAQLNVGSTAQTYLKTVATSVTTAYAAPLESPNGLALPLLATMTPARNSDMTFELATNTSLVVKVRGTDGTVRSATLVLV